MYYITQVEEKENKLVNSTPIENVTYMTQNRIQTITPYGNYSYSPGDKVLIKRVGVKGKSQACSGTILTFEQITKPNSKRYAFRINISLNMTSTDYSQVEQFCNDIKDDLREQGIPV